MLERRGICRPSQSEMEELERLQEFIKEAGEVLTRFPAPDTFLGRKTHEAFPQSYRKIVGCDYPS